MVKKRSSPTAAFLSAAQLFVLFTVAAAARAQNAPRPPAPTRPGSPSTGGGGELPPRTVSAYSVIRIDAIAGVFNIITKVNYNGTDIVNYFGESQRGD